MGDLLVDDLASPSGPGSREPIPTVSAVPASIPDAILIEVERGPNGEALICTGCGTVETVRSIRARHATAFTCCPERKMVPAWRPESSRDGYGELIRRDA